MIMLRSGIVRTNLTKWLVVTGNGSMLYAAALPNLVLILILNSTLSYMLKAGLVEVKVEKYKVPFGTWMAEERPEMRRIGVDQYRDLGGVFS